ncbi:MAG: FecR domain-containing protein [Tannerellaceae bacterium]|nr:FecR domain-containing protein [Tannerellaceae bacterium]
MVVVFYIETAQNRLAMHFNTMNMSEKKYTDFLQDTQFILWRLTRDSEWDSYWEKYLEEHPTDASELQKAIDHFSSVRFRTEKLPANEVEQLLAHIHQRTSQAGKKYSLRRRLTTMVAAACVILLAGTGFYFLQSGTPDELPFRADLIVGENLEEKEIYLITETQTAAFPGDIHIELDRDGSATVRELNGNNPQSLSTAKVQMNKLVVPYGKQSQLTLPDGTNVWINSGSVLEFPSSFEGNNRMINMMGEIYIEVAKDKKPFLVQTPDFSVQVYGTSFNISAYKDNASQSVVLVEGSVGITATGREETRMSPSEMVTLAGNEWSKTLVDVSRYISWKEGYLILEDTPITEVLKQVERFYNLTFDIHDSANLRERTCNGKLYLSNDLDNVMTTISLLSSTRYVRDGKKIYIDMNP